MKKQLNVILLLGLCCQLINTQIPTGSYTETCTIISYNNGQLVATCNDVNQISNTTTLQIAPDANNVNNCNGQLCNESCTGDWQCPTITTAAQAQPLANLQQQLATTTDNLTKIQLNLQILDLQSQIDPNSMLKNFTTTLNTIKTLIPTIELHEYLQELPEIVDQTLHQISQMTPQSSQKMQELPWILSDQELPLILSDFILRMEEILPKIDEILPRKQHYLGLYGNYDN